MASYYKLYTLCLIMNTPVLLSARIRVLSKPQLEIQSSYESLEILPYISSKLADKTVMNEEIDDKDKVLSLFTNTKREVKDAEAILSEMLRVLQNLFAKKPASYTNEKLVSKQNGPQNIAWSYYDDLGK